MFDDLLPSAEALQHADDAAVVATDHKRRRI
jgi:hypothetical protein